MKNPYEKLFVMPAATDQSDPTDRLCRNVMIKIEAREVAQIRGRSFGFGLISIAAIIALIPAVDYLARSFTQSGFGQYLSLLTSDGSIALSHWQDVLMSITETLPVTALTALTALLIISLMSLRWFSRYQASLKSHEHSFASSLA